MINFCQLGASRIGAIHAGNIASHRDARLKMVIASLAAVDSRFRDAFTGMTGRVLGSHRLRH